MTCEHHQRFPMISRECHWNVAVQSAKILAPPWQDHAYPFLVRLQRQGVRRSSWDPTCLGKITFLVNFQVNGYGTSEILLFACDWCFWSTGMWHRCIACEMAVLFYSPWLNLTGNFHSWWMHACHTIDK